MRTPTRFRAETKYAESTDKKANVNRPVMARVGDGGGVAGVVGRPSFYWIRLVNDDNRQTQCSSPIPLGNNDWVYVARAKDEKLSHYEFVAFIEDAAGGTVPPVQVHDLLGPGHGDTTAAAPVRGDIITGQGVAPLWTRLAAATAGAVVMGNGADVISDVTPTIAGLVTGQAGFIATGYTLVGAPAAADYMVFGMDSPTGRIFAYDPVAAAYLALLSDVDIYRLRYTSIDTNVLHYLLRLEVFTSNVAAAGLGTGIEFQIEDAGGGWDVLGTIECISTDVTAAAEHGAIIIRTADIGDDGLAERWRWNEDGEVTANVGGADVGFLHAEGWMGPTFAFVAKNTTGGAVAANDAGYIDDAGEFKYSSVDYEDVAWCVVIEGGANNADIYVTRRGRVTVELNANCAVGDFLYMANVGGNQQRARTETYMRPEMFAVALTANAGGAGGTCSALLYCHTVSRPLSLGDEIYSSLWGNFLSDSDWSGTIQALPGGALVNYTTTGGDENNMVPVVATNHAKIRLYNVTRASYALISDCDPIFGAPPPPDGQITLTAAVPGAWQVGDVITIRSQTNVDVWEGTRFIDFELTGDVDPLARALESHVIFIDTAAADAGTRIHPFEVGVPQRRQGPETYVAVVPSQLHCVTPLIQYRYTQAWNCSGVNTGFVVVRAIGERVASP